ncbi:hypothetical protein [Phaeocystidibacter marisrubri]|uniref:PAP2 family protein n=1 Tax=Phaeocystidibacter marisrubri TaxID=1577780 RepID=A0A6L3ZCV9_9FLAO|nr:hypothetical protein [Phaeocystidibacter marisrubri]KAB2815058.1 hypothetical protein F8C82_13225 [Phaeocystidibacter marisrubri]GGH70064.1 hypothetical protein GCM10011318_11740 [Phaeocystidibacter marisrubri]
MSRRFAQILSYALHPAFIPTLATFFVLWAHPSMFAEYQVMQIVGFMFIATYLLPALFSLLLKQLGVIQSLHMSEPKDRRYPFLISITFFLFAANSLQPWQGVPMELPLLLISSAITIFIFYILLRWTKLSVHLAGMGGLLAVLLFTAHRYEVQILPLLALVFVLTGMLASARLMLKAHTPLQVYVGFSVGFGITLLCLNALSLAGI